MFIKLKKISFKIILFKVNIEKLKITSKYFKWHQFFISLIKMKHNLGIDNLNLSQKLFILLNKLIFHAFLAKIPNEPDLYIQTRFNLLSTKSSLTKYIEIEPLSI